VPQAARLSFYVSSPHRATFKTVLFERVPLEIQSHEGGSVSMPARFALGQTVATPGALDVLKTAGTSPLDLLVRHQAGDWGDVPPEDATENELSVEQGFRILSSYAVGRDRLWVITEADRSVTTILKPSEY
jgi:hypothetical protein